MKGSTKISEAANQSHGAYGSTLFDPRWKARRKEILEMDYNKCVICVAGHNLQVHHRQYHFLKTMNVIKNPGDTRMPWQIRMTVTNRTISPFSGRILTFRCSR